MGTFGLATEMQSAPFKSSRSNPPMPGEELQPDPGAYGCAKALLALHTGERGVSFHLVPIPGLPTNTSLTGIR